MLTDPGVWTADPTAISIVPAPYIRPPTTILLLSLCSPPRFTCQRQKPIAANAPRTVPRELIDTNHATGTRPKGVCKSTAVSIQTMPMLNC